MIRLAATSIRDYKWLSVVINVLVVGPVVGIAMQELTATSYASQLDRLIYFAIGFVLMAAVRF